MMKRTLVPSLLAVLAVLAAGSCGGKRGDGLSVSFDVEALPPAPPEPEPAFVPPPPPPPPEPVPEDPRVVMERRIREVNSRLQPVHFAPDSWGITPGAAAALQANTRVLLGVGPFQATVEGHTDARGVEGYNEWLGLWRAKSVKDALRSLGLDPSLFSLVTHGASVPTDQGETSEAMARNRRVEIVVRTLH
jgi:outer membrane protein OmpA-like peptidoglycan-associated protein